MPDMRKYYNEQVRPALQEKLGLKNVMEIPKLKKIVISTGIGTKMEKDAFSEARTHLSAIAGQAPVVCKSRKNIANFKLRAGMSVGPTTPSPASATSAAPRRRASTTSETTISAFRMSRSSPKSTSTRSNIRSE